ncbi:MAG: glycosyltransferase [Rhodobacterales bacterium]
MESSTPARIKTSHVTILMATFNGMPWVTEQLASLLGQTHQDWSLWVSDDGSSDGTRAAIRAFGAVHPGRLARLIKGPGRGAADNFMHMLCHPDLPPGIVALCDQDDVWLPEKLSYAVAALGASAARPAVWSARYLISDAGLSQSRASALWPHPPGLGNAMVQNILSGHTLTINAPALAALRRAGHRQVPHHDWWVYLVMAAIGAVIHVDHRLVLHYRQHGRNVMGARHLTRLVRLRGVLDGTLQRWIAANIAALAASDLPLTPEAQDLVARWQNPVKGRLRVMRDFGLHRQSWLETRILHLVAALGKL